MKELAGVLGILYYTHYKVYYWFWRYWMGWERNWIFSDLTNKKLMVFQSLFKGFSVQKKFEYQIKLF